MHVNCCDGRVVACDKIRVTTGRKPNSDTIDMAAAGLRADDRGWVQVDLETLEAADGIYAIGDINGLGGVPPLSHYHGTVGGGRPRGGGVPPHHPPIPPVPHTDPPAGAVGVSEGPSPG